MTPRAVNFQERKERILGIVVHQYIKTITPVSSQYIVKRYFPDLSSATVRNILAELERDGFLSHPHTSAGRVPTQLGYRYYVDNLMNEIKLLEEEKIRIQTEYKKDVNELEVLLDKTSEVLSDLTHYTSIVSVDGVQEKFYCHGMSFVAGYPEFQDFNRVKEILMMLETKEHLLELINRELERKVEIYIGAEMKCKGINECSLVVSSYEKKDGPSGRLAILGPTRMNYDRVVSALEYFSELMNEML